MGHVSAFGRCGTHATTSARHAVPMIERLLESHRSSELKIIAAIFERPVIEKILEHLGLGPQPRKRLAAAP